LSKSKNSKNYRPFLTILGRGVPILFLVAIWIATQSQLGLVSTQFTLTYIDLLW